MTKLLFAGLMTAVAVPALAQVPAPAVAPAAPTVAPSIVPVRPIAPRAMTRAEVTTHVAQLFARFDTNRDGVITQAEVDAARQAMASTPPAAAGEHHRGMHGMGGMGARMFAMADANHDGRLTMAEAQAEALAHFDMMDANHDGIVTADERQAARAEMMMMKKGK